MVPESIQSHTPTESIGYSQAERGQKRWVRGCKTKTLFWNYTICQLNRTDSDTCSPNKIYTHEQYCSTTYATCRGTQLIVITHESFIILIFETNLLTIDCHNQILFCLPPLLSVSLFDQFQPATTGQG